MTLVEFLRARLDEDQEAAEKAKAARGADWHSFQVTPGLSWQINGTVDPYGITRLPETGTFRTHASSLAQHITLHDPARVLRGVRAKRRLLAEFERCGPQTQGHIGLFGALRIAATEYDDHPDYDEVWRP